ncbi:MAG: hypothetical protein AAGC55_14420, partial [Myxococcota bacterium]
MKTTEDKTNQTSADNAPVVALGSPGRRTAVQARYGGSAGQGVVQRKADDSGASSAQSQAEGHDHHGHHGHDSEPEPGDGGGGDLDTTRPVGDNVPDETRTALMAEMQRSPRMQQVLEEIADNGGASFDIKWSARGNYHRSGAIHLDRRRDMDRWVPSMMHELN